jgi:hypothetical protein
MPGSAAFWTSGDADEAARVVEILWGRAASVQQLPEGVK